VTAFALAVLAAAPWSALDDDQARQRFEAGRSLPLAERLLAHSRGFLGTAYRLSPLGEGQGLDPDPVLRWDLVDCQTLVEQSLALGLSERFEDVEPTLQRLRYLGPPAWETRAHLTEAQWLPHLVGLGVLVDVTRSLAGASTVRVAKELSADTWRQPEGQALRLPEEARPTGRFELEVVPPSEALRVLRRAPSGLVVVVVRGDNPRRITRVSHMGLLVQGASGPVLRHASRSFRRAVDEPLARYLERNLAHGAWTVAGLAVFEARPLDGRAR
jgi:hypothetical protein